MFTPTSNYPKFDVHAHVLPADIPDFEKQFGYGGFVKLQDNPKNENGSKDMIKNGRLFRTVEKNCFDTDTRIAEMDACHVNVQAVSTVPVMFHYWAKAGDAEITSRFINNDIYKECRKYPSRLVPVGTLPLQNMDLSLRQISGLLDLIQYFSPALKTPYDT
uniref:2-amino-3-carboxymuconate-6-semialdehyde decarboxylase n=1 Tax=Rhabditophanes sp. KR3021 TaxID=114890 RepID=A0AC35TRD0_9BILA